MMSNYGVEERMSTLDELEKKYKELGEEIEKLKAEKENEPWKPKDGEPYVYLSINGFTRFDEWRDSYPQILMYNMGNVFRTQEEAEFRAEQLKVEAELRRFSRKFVPNNQNYYLRYAHNNKAIYVEDVLYIQNGDIYFDTVDIARQAVKTVGEERIKKYYFGVEE